MPVVPAASSRGDARFCLRASAPRRALATAPPPDPGSIALPRERVSLSLCSAIGESRRAEALCTVRDRSSLINRVAGCVTRRDARALLREPCGATTAPLFLPRSRSRGCVAHSQRAVFRAFRSILEAQDGSTNELYVLGRVSGQQGHGRLRRPPRLRRPAALAASHHAAEQGGPALERGPGATHVYHLYVVHHV